MDDRHVETAIGPQRRAATPGYSGSRLTVDTRVSIQALVEPVIRRHPVLNVIEGRPH